MRGTTALIEHRVEVLDVTQHLVIRNRTLGQTSADPRIKARTDDIKAVGEPEGDGHLHNAANVLG